jgi:UDP-2-acetamido-2,6-beta-L-arabino-hexul-4-ose reductase
MKTIVVTGAKGFIGRNLVAWLSTLPDLTILPLDIEDSAAALAAALGRADFVFHLAGTNRPERPEEFDEGNAGVTRGVVRQLESGGRPVPVLLTSSTQALLDNPYGLSKRRAEEAVFGYGEATGAAIFVYRLPNVFGKWSRPNYNSVVATFCHNVAHGLPLQVNDPDRELHLVHIDDVVASFVGALEGRVKPDADGTCSIPKSFTIRLQDLADRVRSFPLARTTREVPDLGDELTRLLYSMYLTYLPQDQFSYTLEMKRDQRGWLAEFVRTANAGQVFVSITRPGITRGNHWHHTKTEKFLVVQGQAMIRFREIAGDRVLEYPVSGDCLQVVDIPPGYAHAITNVGTADVITIFWASEPFDPSRPDTMSLSV